ncbi:MAG: hypothetical protein GY864_03100 [Desulfobacterales bacterium]|nr:hypothetical protein [Desulfobacterales bacterium]
MNVTGNDVFSKILRNGPSEGTFLSVLTEMKEKGEHSEVIRECLNALKVFPDDIRLRRVLSECYLELGSVGQGENELTRITGVIDDLISVYKIQAGIFIQQQRFGEAATAIKKFLAHNPDDREALDLMDRVKPEVSGKERPNPVEDNTEDEDDEEIFTELATPTLAEICFNQGEIEEAINTYEKVLVNDPNDHASARRLTELKKLIKGETDIPTGKRDGIKADKIKIIAILERWLAKIQEMSSARQNI